MGNPVEEKNFLLSCEQGEIIAVEIRGKFISQNGIDVTYRK
jgi:hypothetical protein